MKFWSPKLYPDDLFKRRAVKLRVQSWLTLIIGCQLVFVLKYILMGMIFQVFETTNLYKSFVTMYVLN